MHSRLPHLIVLRPVNFISPFTSRSYNLPLPFRIANQNFIFFSCFSIDSQLYAPPTHAAPLHYYNKFYNLHKHCYMTLQLHEASLFQWQQTIHRLPLCATFAVYLRTRIYGSESFRAAPGRPCGSEAGSVLVSGLLAVCSGGKEFVSGGQHCDEILLVLGRLCLGEGLEIKLRQAAYSRTSQRCGWDKVLRH